MLSPSILDGWVDTGGVRVGATARPLPAACRRKINKKLDFWQAVSIQILGPQGLGAPRAQGPPKVGFLKSTTFEDLGPQGPQNLISGHGFAMRINGL